MTEAKTILMVICALIVFLLGSAHLVFTFWGPKLLPRDPRLIESMKSVALVLTNETTVWKAWIGFNASHSMAAILFGLVYGYMAVIHPGLLFSSTFLQIVGFLTLAAFVSLAFVYWFSLPFIGLSLALCCYVASVLAARA